MTHIAPPPPPPPAAAALPPCPAWLREDCCALYRQEFVVTSVNSNCLAVQDRVGLLRVGITLARQVTRRFPDALFLEMGVHEGKDLVRMATFLRSIEERQHYQEQRRRDKRNKHLQSQPQQNRTSLITKNYTNFHGFDSFEGLPEDWNNGQFQEVVRVDDNDNHNNHTNNNNNHHTNNNNNTNNTTTMTQPRREPLHKQGAFDTGGKVPDVAYLVEQYLILGDHGRTNTHRKYHHNQHNHNNRTARDTTESTLATQNTNTGRSLSQSNSNSVIETIQIHKGWFQDSVPQFFDAQITTTTKTPVVVAFVHADADLYTSTVTFLEVLCARNLFRKGSIIIFDEFWNYPHWQEGEYKAWMDIVTKYGLESKYQYFGYHAPPPATSTAIATDGLTTTTTATNHNHNHKTKRKTTKKKFKHYGYQSVGVVMTSDL